MSAVAIEWVHTIHHVTLWVNVVVDRVSEAQNVITAYLDFGVSTLSLKALSDADVRLLIESTNIFVSIHYCLHKSTITNNYFCL